MKVNSTALALSKMLADLTTRDCKVMDLVATTGLRRETIGEYLYYLHKEGLVHIRKYERASNGHAMIQVWAWGFDDDAPRPPHQTKAVKNARQRVKRVMAGYRTSTVL